MKSGKALYLLVGVIAPLGLMIAASNGSQTNKMVIKPAAKIQEQAAFYVVGLARRTNNAKEASATGEIPKVWQAFMQTRLADGIPRKIDDDLLAIYTDYESDQNGDYTYLLGKRVSDLRDVPPGLTGRHVPAGRYATLVSEKGPLPQVVPNLWKRVWSMTPAHLGGRRAFRTDYELYDGRARDPKDGQVTLYLGLQ